MAGFDSSTFAPTYDPSFDVPATYTRTSQTSQTEPTPPPPPKGGQNGFAPNYVLLHDVGGSGEQYRGDDAKKPPYNAVIYPDGSRVYRNPDDPYGSQAPHAYRFNPRSVGIAYAGQVGSTPTPEGMDAIREEVDRATKQHGIQPDHILSHGEAYALTQGTSQQASKDGRDLDEASWRKYIRDPSLPLPTDVAGPGRGIGSARLAQGGPTMTDAQPPAQPTQRPYQPNFIDRLAHNPMFMAGVSALGTAPGGNWGPNAAQAAAQTTNSMISAGEYANTSQQRAARQAIWNQVFPNGSPNMQHPLLQGVPQEIAQAAAAGGADEGLPFLQKYQMASGEQKLALQKQFDLLKIQIAQGVASGKITQEEAQRFLSALPGGSTGTAPAGATTPQAPRTGNAAFFPQSQPPAAGPPTAAPTAAAPPAAGPGSTPQTPGQAPGSYDTGMSAQADQEVGLPELSPRAKQILNDMRWADALGLHDRSRLYADQLKEEPSVIARAAFAKKIGENDAGLAERRRAGTNILKTFDQFQDAVQEMRSEDPAAFNSAIGRLNQSDIFQTVRGATIGRAPITHYRQAADYKNRMDHLVDGLTTAFMASASANGVPASDARMAKFNEAMGAMRKASTPQEFDKIMNDARGIIKNMFSLDTASLGKQGQTAKEQPPIGGAKKAPDGNWYVKDPQRPGKYLRVDQ